MSFRIEDKTRRHKDPPLVNVVVQKGNVGSYHVNVSGQWRVDNNAALALLAGSDCERAARETNVEYWS
jgi:hypothetical protein